MPEIIIDPVWPWSDGVLFPRVARVLAIAALEGEADHYLGQVSPLSSRSQLSPDYTDYGIPATLSQRVADIISEVMDGVAADAGSAFDASMEDFATAGLHDYAMFLLEGAARLREEKTP